MIPRECKRLAEVDFPIAKVSELAAREKSTPRAGHPSTLHVWWARRPLASSRALLMALLLPDPCDPHCRDEFKRKARQLLPLVGCGRCDTDQSLRDGLIKFIGNVASWDNTTDRTHLEVSQKLVMAAHDEKQLLVVDPFAGGGSIPLEAIRLGCEAFASDLNPVACLILKVMLEDIPRHVLKGTDAIDGLIDELQRLGDKVKREAFKKLEDLYPHDADGSTPIAYLWARTVRCETSDCGAEIPIYRSPWLSRKHAKSARYFKETPTGNCTAILISDNQRGGPVTFRIARGEGSEDRKDGFVELQGTKAKGNNSNVVCPCCGTLLSGAKRNPRVPIQLAAQKGGADVIFDENGRRVAGARLLAVVTLRQGERGRHYRLPTDSDYDAVRRSQIRLEKILKEWEKSSEPGICPVPDEPLPPIGTLGFRVQRYGMLQWGDLFAARQKLALIELSRKTFEFDASVQQTLLALLLGKMADGNNSCSSWDNSAENTVNLFTRQAIPIIWDFCESTPSSTARGVFLSNVDAACKVVRNTKIVNSGQVQSADATDHPLPDQSASVWFTDPPYYDAIPYSDLSDFFFVWLKRVLPDHPLLRDRFDSNNPLSPKEREAVQDETKKCKNRVKDRRFFEDVMGRAFAEGRRVLTEDGIGCVVFAHKSTEGWEALLSGIIRGGWTITGSWPIATERGSRLRARDSAALATSVHLICRPRAQDAPVGDWADVLQELPGRVVYWMERLQREGIRGADLVFACIGPALEIFSRYRSVETAEGDSIGLFEYLERVWEIVGRTALRQILGSGEVRASEDLSGMLEEDARLTALFLWTMQSTDLRKDNGKPDQTEEETADGTVEKGFRLPFDVVRRFAQPMGINLDNWTGRIVGQKKGVVRLLPVSERAAKLFGKEGTAAVAKRIESDPQTDIQQSLFPILDEHLASVVREQRPRYGETTADQSKRKPNDTTLDRVHAAMLFQSSGHANALRKLIGDEQERGPEFLRLANALSALYPRGCFEKRLLDAMLLAVPR